MTNRPSGDEAVALRLAEILKRYRHPPGAEKAIFTQEEAADRIGISRNHYQRLERSGGEEARKRVENPRYSTLKAIADFIEFPVSELVVELEFAREDTSEESESSAHGKKKPPPSKD